MNLKKAKFLRNKKNIKAKVFNYKQDEVIWVNGKKLVRDLISHNGITSIVPVLDKRFIILLKQYRYGSDQIMLEVPAGTIDTGEKPLVCAKRELIEETGYQGKNWKNLGKYFPTPAYNSCKVHCYSADCLKKGDQNLDPDEVIDIVIYSIKEIKKILNENKLLDMKTYISLDRFFKNY